MSTLNPSLQLLVSLAKIQAIVTRRFDSSLNGLGFSEFMILFHLSQAEDQKMRRIDLAEKIGLTASGVTRMLLPMEKIGLVDRGTTDHDARVRYVILAPGGREKLTDALERAELLAQDLIPTTKLKKVEQMTQLLKELMG